ncbi:hypothetical protein B0O99DRAFT_305590 [Bisporella sp. PMI_857]|nr:hypothetical protein B0O99DRAFT_305590 [Bisporella sp. PMI_857]
MEWLFSGPPPHISRRRCANVKIQAALPASHPTNCGLGTTIPPPRSPPPPVIKKYTALCVNTGEFNKTLGEIDISSITTDRQMFHRFKEAYHELRGFRARAVRWFLIKPVDIKFIQVRPILKVVYVHSLMFLVLRRRLSPSRYHS